MALPCESLDVHPDTGDFDDDDLDSHCEDEGWVRRKRIQTEASTRARVQAILPVPTRMMRKSELFRMPSKTFHSLFTFRALISLKLVIITNVWKTKV